MTAWSVAIFSSREDAATLTRTLDAVAAACGPYEATIDVLVDDNPATASAMAAWQPPAGLAGTVRLWSLGWRDKACAWNRYLAELMPRDPRPAVAFFVDGYIRPAPVSFAALADALARQPDAWAASGVPTVGPSAARVRSILVTDGGLHGSLYALRGSVAASLVDRGFHLPLGLYRNDSLLGAVMAFAGDPASQPWDPRRRIAVAATATWDHDQLPLWSVARWKASLKRRLRQAQGELENAAVRQHLAVRKQAPERLPRTVAELVVGDLDRTLFRSGLLGRLLRRRAAARLAIPVDWARATTAPALVQSWRRP